MIGCPECKARSAGMFKKLFKKTKQRTYVCTKCNAEVKIRIVWWKVIVFGVCAGFFAAIINLLARVPDTAEVYVIGIIAGITGALLVQLSTIVEPISKNQDK